MGWVYHATPEVNDRSQYPTILAVCTTLTTMMTAVVCMRGYVRAIMLNNFAADDWTILFSAICSIVYNALCIAQTRYGLGLPVELRPKPSLEDYTVVNFSGRLFYMAGITGFKVALCIAYLRIVPPKDRRVFNPLIWVVMVTCILGHLGGSLVLFFMCTPVQRSWRPLTPGKCLPNDSTFYGLAAVTIFYDCVIFLLPIPLLLRVQINTRRKIALMGVFLLGLFTTLCSIIRMVQIRTIAKTKNSTMLVLWGTIEMNVGIAVTCLPFLMPLFKFLKDIRDRSDKNAYPYNHSDSDRTATNDQHQLETISTKRTRSMYRPREKDLEDSSSQESILGVDTTRVEAVETPPAAHVQNLGGITRTTDVDIKITPALGAPTAT